MKLAMILHGGHDVLGVQAAREGYEYAKKVGVDVTFMLVESDMTGAEHCQPRQSDASPGRN